MPARYDENGNFIYPEGFDPQSQEWKPGYEAQREEWERQYAEAQADSLRTRSRKLKRKPLMLQLLQSLLLKRSSQNVQTILGLGQRGPVLFF